MMNTPSEKNRAPGIGKVQRAILRSMSMHGGVWNRGTNWRFGSPYQMVQALNRLLPYGYVTHTPPAEGCIEEWTLTDLGKAEAIKLDD